MGYVDALAQQRFRRDAIVAGRAPEAMWLLEHDPVITTGRRGVPELGAAGLHGHLPVVSTERGGLATYHGPGQLVGYLLLDLGSRRAGPRLAVRAIEAGLIHWLARRGLPAERHADHVGVFVEGRKIAAIGLHFRRGVSMHGFALNLNVDLAGFQGFTPCGLTGVLPTSVLAEAGESPAPEGVAIEVGAEVIASVSGAVDSAHQNR